MKKISYYWILIIVLVACQQSNKHKKSMPQNEILQNKSMVIVSDNGVPFRDLNKNKKLDVYEDIHQPINNRVENLLNQMNLEEKAGMMFINGAPVSEDAKPDGKAGLKAPFDMMPTVVENIKVRQMNHFNIWHIPSDPMIFAKWYNNVQQLAEQTRLGIPITIASDPRHHFSNSIFSMSATGFTQFCEMPGFGAIGDTDIVREIAAIIREEYRAIGIRMALHPQIDLATEPRWPRINGSFSEDAELTARLVRPYIEGMQTNDLSKGVACMTKHFPGGGPQKEGLDPHFSFQKGQIYPGENFEYHLIPFQTAIELNTSAMMPYYGVPTDQTDENVAMAYNKTIITTLLRERYKYDGVICTDWGLISDLQIGPNLVWKARAWGVENLSEVERVMKIIDAGCDQFGGENKPELVLQLVREKKLTTQRIDQSVRRLLKLKFELGLFDNPFVDETKINAILGKESSRKLGEKTQQISMTLLKNENSILPIQKKSTKIYVENMDHAVVENYAEVVHSPKEADLAIIRLHTPWYAVDTKNIFAASFHHGDLNFKGAEKTRILNLLNNVPTIVDIYLDRPAVIPEITASAEAVIANYGASDQSVCEVLFGNVSPQGKLPFELPSSMEAVLKQKADVPYDSRNPLFTFGHGLEYIKRKN